MGVPVLRPEVASGTGTGTGGLHSGHDVGPAVVEITGRALGYVGFMLASGLFVFGFVVLRPALPLRRGSRRSPRASPRAGSPGSVAGGSLGGSLAAWRRRLGTSDPWSVLIATQAVALLVGGVGAAVLSLTTSSGPGADLVDYLAGTRSGLLIVARLAVALGGAATVTALLRTGRPGPATAAGGLAGFVALVLVAMSGHASSFVSPAPLAVMIVHLGAVSVWVAGVVALAWLALAVRRSDLLRATVPRFSALALVSVALIALTGAAAAWAETREILPFDTPYGLALAAKTALFALALGLGAANFVDGGRGRPTSGFLRGRLLVEVTVAAIVLLAAGNLASGSPPVPSEPSRSPGRRAPPRRPARSGSTSGPGGRARTGSRLSFRAASPTSRPSSCSSSASTRMSASRGSTCVGPTAQRLRAWDRARSSSLTVASCRPRANGRPRRQSSRRTAPR